MHSVIFAIKVINQSIKLIKHKITLFAMIVPINAVSEVVFHFEDSSKYMKLSSKIRYTISFSIKLRLSLNQSNGIMTIRNMVYTSCIPECKEALTICDENVINIMIHSINISLLKKNIGVNSLAFLVFNDTFLFLSASMLCLGATELLFLVF